MRRSLKWAAVAVGAAGIVAAAFVGGRAWAGGIPAAGALTYSGLLQDATGAPLTGTQYVEVKFWNDTAASAAANLLCDTGTPTGIGLVNGRFSIPLPDACTTKVGSNADVWAEVLVGTTAKTAGALGRAKIGAVPFAVEANHSVSADSATSASGALKTTTDGYAARLTALEARHDLNVFAKGGDNGSQSCNQWCANLPTGQTGTCVGAQWQAGPLSGQYESCDATATSTGQAAANFQCWCARPL